jgi:hypothetical protein
VAERFVGIERLGRALQFRQDCEKQGRKQEADFSHRDGTPGDRTTAAAGQLPPKQVLFYFVFACSGKQTLTPEAVPEAVSVDGMRVQ